MKTVRVHRVVMVVLSCIGWLGCAESPSSRVGGIIVPPRSAVDVGRYAPDARFQDPSGRDYWLSSVYEDATVLAFVEESCSRPHADLIRAKEKLGEQVQVVEVCSGEHHSEAEPVEALSDGTSLFMLCDEKQILTRRYGLEQSDAVFLLDRQGRVVERGTLSDLAVLTQRARQVATAAARQRDRLYGGN
jgi:hypothetical protein